MLLALLPNENKKSKLILKFEEFHMKRKTLGKEKDEGWGRILLKGKKIIRYLQILTQQLFFFAQLQPKSAKRILAPVSISKIISCFVSTKLQVSIVCEAKSQKDHFLCGNKNKITLRRGQFNLLFNRQASQVRGSVCS